MPALLKFMKRKFNSIQFQLCSLGHFKRPTKRMFQIYGLLDVTRQIWCQVCLNSSKTPDFF